VVKIPQESIRDSLYRTAVDVVLQVAARGTTVMGTTTTRRFVCGLAEDLAIPEARAADMLRVRRVTAAFVSVPGSSPHAEGPGLCGLLSNATEVRKRREACHRGQAQTLQVKSPTEVDSLFRSGFKSIEAELLSRVANQVPHKLQPKTKTKRFVTSGYVGCGFRTGRTHQPRYPAALRPCVRCAKTSQSHLRHSRVCLLAGQRIVPGAEPCVHPGRASKEKSVSSASKKGLTGSFSSQTTS